MEREHRNINYLYFIIFFFIVCFIHSYHHALLQKEFSVIQAFYLVHTLIQSLLEVLGLIIIGNILSKLLSKTIEVCFVILTLLLLFIHLLDFSLLRFMDMSVWFSLELIFAETWINFVEILLASNISLASWITSAIGTLLLLTLGVSIYYLMDRWSQKKAVRFSYKVAGYSFGSLLLFLVLFDFNLSPFAILTSGTHFSKALPWKTTFFAKAYPEINLGRKLGHKPPERDYLQELNQAQISLVKKPNIFLFIIESLREDFLTPENTPFLAQFKKKNERSSCSLSSANATHFSWFSIFHSVYPFRWEERQPHLWSSGSFPLRILKKAGYRINLYSSARLDLYRMNDILFGKQHELIDSYNNFGDETSRPVYEKDLLSMCSLSEHLKENLEGNIFLIFLDSTHFDYSWPEQESPNSKKVNFLNLMRTRDVDTVQSRYCHALQFVDTLFGNFLEQLAHLYLDQEAIIIVTGDHGEEFYEQGNIFHASKLTPMQTRVPIHYQLPFSSKVIQTSSLSSHVDIFPTLLDYLIDSPNFDNWFDGESLLKQKKKNFILSTRYNGSRNPFEFLIHDGSNQLIARFTNRKNIFQSSTIQVISRLNHANLSMEIDPQAIKKDFKTTWETLLSAE